MPFQEIVAPSIRELFVQQLTGLILSGELRPGDRLPTERELADEMKISKTVVHEGIRELRRQGFLDVSSRRGVTVADYAQTGSLETLMAIMDYHGGLPDRKTACSILELRDYLEAPAMEHLAAHHTEADLAALRALQQQAGKSIEEVRDYLEDIKLHLCHWFTVDDLMYLKRGGRISATTAVLGTVMQIKPVMHMDNDGHLANVTKARGRKASLIALAEKALTTSTDLPSQTMFICHGDCYDDAKFVADYIRERSKVQDIIINYVGPVIGSHTGPGVVSVFFLGTER